jgi:phage terminase large subunit-like protein
MVRAEPELAEIIRVQRWHLEGPRDSIYRVLSADAELQQGLNPSFVIFDEVHVQPDRELWDAMVLGMGARLRPMIVGITTAGFDKTTLAWDLYERGKRGEFYFRWWEPTDPNCDWRDERSWKEANPALGDFLLAEAVAEDAKITPEAAFRRFHLNQWTSTYSAWFAHGVFESRKVMREVKPDEPVVLFFDGSWANDSTGIVGCTLDGHLFVVEAWEKPDNEPEWRVPTDEVEARIRRCFTELDVVELAFDPARWQDIFTRLANEQFPVVEWPTNSLARMVPACQEFYTAVTEGRVTHDGDPRLVRHIANAQLKEDHRGSRIVKETKSSPRKIDLAVCAVGAFDRARAHVPEKREPKYAWA